MIVLDTHAWLWWIQGNTVDLPDAVKQRIDASDTVSVSAVSCLEVAWLEKKRRIALPLPITDFLKLALEGSRIGLLPLTPTIAARSAALPEIHRDPIDRIIIATAIEHSAELISRDRIFTRYPDVRVQWA
ncbi:MAG: type II toxin-antitoxin system VapC family toxin [Deltaproteobacteria bacterium]|nr:type II toxin-antitoxin system VapC family toxin [Deltaproteobacteria bacterium]